MRETEWEGAAAEGRGTDERNRVGRHGCGGKGNR